MSSINDNTPEVLNSVSKSNTILESVVPIDPTPIHNLIADKQPVKNDDDVRDSGQNNVHQISVCQPITKNNQSETINELAFSFNQGMQQGPEAPTETGFLNNKTPQFQSQFFDNGNNADTQTEDEFITNVHSFSNSLGYKQDKKQDDVKVGQRFNSTVNYNNSASEDDSKQRESSERIYPSNTGVSKSTMLMMACAAIIITTVVIFKTHGDTEKLTPP
jgi:hypothetical protein